ncbi:hypothetical protein NEOKW01_1499 [Nematocida sp. AWRm80]|nr:hypothetical protein NEOKW01_1499 [Nematocida sp. AWRm80]
MEELLEKITYCIAGRTRNAAYSVLDTYLQNKQVQQNITLYRRAILVKAYSLIADRKFSEGERYLTGMIEETTLSSKETLLETNDYNDILNQYTPAQKSKLQKYIKALYSAAKTHLEKQMLKLSLLYLNHLEEIDLNNLELEDKYEIYLLRNDYSKCKLLSAKLVSSSGSYSLISLLLIGPPFPFTLKLLLDRVIVNNSLIMHLYQNGVPWNTLKKYVTSRDSSFYFLMKTLFVNGINISEYFSNPVTNLLDVIDDWEIYQYSIDNGITIESVIKDSSKPSINYLRYIMITDPSIDTITQFVIRTSRIDLAEEYISKLSSDERITLLTGIKDKSTSETEYVPENIHSIDSSISYLNQNNDNMTHITNHNHRNTNITAITALKLQHLLQKYPKSTNITETNIDDPLDKSTLWPESIWYGIPDILLSDVSGFIYLIESLISTKDTTSLVVALTLCYLYKEKYPNTFQIRVLLCVLYRYFLMTEELIEEYMILSPELVQLEELTYLWSDPSIIMSIHPTTLITKYIHSHRELITQLNLRVLEFITGHKYTQALSMLKMRNTLIHSPIFSQVTTGKLHPYNRSSSIEKIFTNPNSKYIFSKIDHYPTPSPSIFSTINTYSTNYNPMDTDHIFTKISSLLEKYPEDLSKISSFSKIFHQKQVQIQSTLSNSK